MALVFDSDVAREIVNALSAVEAREAGRTFAYTIATQSDAPTIGTRDHHGVLRDQADDSLTIGAETGDVVIAWYEITAISVAPD